MTKDDSLCPICNMPTEDNANDSPDYNEINCYRCGEYTIQRLALSCFESYKDNKLKVANISGWIREHQQFTIKRDDMIRLIDLKSLDLLRYKV